MELVGLEALSRGAKCAIMCDNSKQAIDIIKKNIEKTHAKENVKLYHMDFRELLKNEIKENPTITFIDPPYDTDFAYEAVKIMEQNGLINERSIIIIETDQEQRIIQQIKDLKIDINDTRKYGRAKLIFLGKKRKG